MTVLAGYVIVLAYELVVFEHVELLAGGQLFPAYHARETVEVKDFIPSFPHEVRGRYALGATVALFAVPPVTKQRINNKLRVDGHRTGGVCTRYTYAKQKRERKKGKKNPVYIGCR